LHDAGALIPGSARPQPANGRNPSEYRSAGGPRRDSAGRRRHRVREASGSDHQDENQPGAGAATFRKLADSGVNADLLVPVRVSEDLFFAVICVDDPDKARRALGVQIIGEDDFVL